MSILKLEDVKIKMPKDFNGNPTEAQFIEWLEFEIGARSDIKLSNPLHKVELRDCNVSVKGATINDKPFFL